MSGKSIKALADQLWKNHGVSLITTFDSGIVPGSVLERRSWNDISRVGHLKDGVKAADLPDVQGPVPCMLADFRRSHEMNIDAALRLLQPTDAGAESQFKRASEAVATFDAPVIYSMSLLAIEDAIESQPAPFWDRALGQWLKDGKTRVVYQVIRSRLTFIFRGAGGRGLDLRAVLGPLGGLGLGGQWRWRNEGTRESTRELGVAVEEGKYNNGKKRFDSIVASLRHRHCPPRPTLPRGPSAALRLSPLPLAPRKMNVSRLRITWYTTRVLPSLSHWPSALSQKGAG